MGACGPVGETCGGGGNVDRPSSEGTDIGKQFLDLLGKGDARTQQMFYMIQSLPGQAGAQASDILAGGPGPYTPAIQTAIGSAGQQFSQSTDQAEQGWNRMGITGTDYARLSSDNARTGGQQIAGIPSAMTGPVLQQIFAALTGSQAQAVQSQGQGLSTAAGVTGAAIQPIKGDPATLLGGIGLDKL